MPMRPDLLRLRLEKAVRIRRTLRRTTLQFQELGARVLEQRRRGPATDAGPDGRALAIAVADALRGARIP